MASEIWDPNFNTEIDEKLEADLQQEEFDDEDRITEEQIRRENAIDEAKKKAHSLGHSEELHYFPKDGTAPQVIIVQPDGSTKESSTNPIGRYELATTGMTTDGNGNVTGGMLTGLTFTMYGVKAMTITDFAPVDLKDFLDAVVSPNVANRYQAVVGLLDGDSTSDASGITDDFGRVLETGSGNDTVTGSKGGDLIIKFKSGDLTLNGGDGMDTLSFQAEYGKNADLVQQLVVDLDTGVGSNPYGGTLALTDIEGIVGTAAADIIDGNDEDNVVGDGVYDGGADQIKTFGGNDTVKINSVAAARAIDGGDDIDTLFVEIDNIAATHTLDLKDQNNNTGAFGLGTYENFEIYQFGNSFSSNAATQLNFIGTDDAETLINVRYKANIQLYDGDDRLELGTIGGRPVTADGGDGIDTLAAYAFTNFVLDLNNQANNTGFFAGGTFTNFEVFEVLGATSVASLTFKGDGNNNAVTGGYSNDILDGGSGNDVLDGGLSYPGANGGGDDKLTGGLGFDTVSYASASVAVTVNLGSTAAQKTGGAGKDTLSGFEKLTGSAFNDVLSGGTAGETFDGGDGNDIINGGAGIDTLNGGGGDDLLTGGLDADTIDGGTDSVTGDTASYATSKAAVTVDLTTNVNKGGEAEGDLLSEIENLIGSKGIDSLTGDLGDNVLTGGASADKLDGVSGNDTASYSTATAGVTASLLTGTGTGGDAKGDTYFNIDNLVGGAKDDVLTGNGDNNRIDGGDGKDIILYVAGNDKLNGGNGVDTLSFAAAVPTDIVANLKTGTLTGDVYTSTLTAFENIIGSVQGDDFTGDDNANAIGGGAGDDNINGGAGNDTLSGDAGFDTADFSGAAAAVTVSLAVTAAQKTGGAGTDTIKLFEALTGSDYNDILTGDKLVNILNGGGGDDILAGGLGADDLNGGLHDAFGDTASYAASAAAVTVDLTTNVNKGGDAEGDTLTGIENLIGGKGVDSLTGDTNDNVLTGGAGADKLDGVVGNDTASYSNATAAVTASLLAGTGTVGDAKGDTYFNIDNLIGGSKNDKLTGDASDNVIDGGLGNDTLDGGDGTDTLSYARATAAVTVDLTLAGVNKTGGAGDDLATNFENLTGSDFDDVLRGTGGVNVISGGNGNDVIEGGALGDTLDGGAGVNTLSYANATDFVSVDLGTGATSGTDAAGDTFTGFTNLRGGLEADILRGDGNDNVIEGGAGGDFIVGGNNGAFGDTVSYQHSQLGVSVFLGLFSGQGGDAASDTLDGIENVIGSSKDDLIEGDINANNIQGGDGNDLITGFDGADILDGGAGINWLNYAPDTAGVTVDLLTGKVSGGEAEGDVIKNFTIVSGGSGNDIFVSGLAANTFNGNGGKDTVSYAGSTAGVTVTMGGPAGKGGTAAGDILNDIEVLLGSSKNDVLTGDGADNIIDGGLGDDKLNGGLGNDTLLYASASAALTINLGLTTAQKTGGGGKDTISNFEHITGSNFDDVLTGNAAANNIDGGGGNDIIQGASGGDDLDGGTGLNTLSYSLSVLGVTIDLLNKTATGGDATGDTIENFRNIIGSAAADDLTGDTGDNVFDGGKGGDLINGGDGTDLVSYTNSAAPVTVDLAVNSFNAGDAEGDELVNIEQIAGSKFNDILTGNDSNNYFDGGAGVDTINGGKGDDTIIGGAGADILTGGEGDDRFEFFSIKDGGDKIADFNSHGDADPANDDTIVIHMDGFPKSADSLFRLEKESVTKADTGFATFLYDIDDGKLYYDADGNGSGAAVLLLQFINPTFNQFQFSSNDFLLV